jgi:hypothetical protein
MSSLRKKFHNVFEYYNSHYLNKSIVEEGKFFKLILCDVQKKIQKKICKILLKINIYFKNNLNDFNLYES